jgi:PAS domain S-box-containing protein
MGDSQKTRQEVSQAWADLEAGHRELVTGLLEGVRELEERAKELNCLYGISRLVEQADLSLPEILQGTVELIPPAWQYPELVCARIVLREQTYQTTGFRETIWQQSCDIRVRGEPEGRIEVYYLEERPEEDEGPFLKEERDLLNAIAERLGRVVERIRAETILSESEATARGLLDAITERAMLLDRDGAILHVNEAMAARLGRPVEELVGALARDQVSPDVAEPQKGFFWDVVHSGEPHRFAYERDGNWFDNTFYPILDEEGRVARVAVLVRDVTQFKETERALRESEQVYRSLFEQALVGMISAGADRIITAVNPAAVRILGYDRAEELIGRPAGETWFRTPEAREAVQKAHTLGHLPPCEIILEGKGGRLIPCLVSAAVFKEADGGFGGFVATFTDITEQKRAEEALQRSHAELERRVAQRTVSLTEINALLQKEVDRREEVEHRLLLANRRLRMLIEGGQAVIRATEEGALLDEICRIVVDSGGYRLAWIGYAEQDEEQTVRPVAQAGFEDGYLETLRITWADRERGRGPTGTAIRTGQPSLARDLQRDPKFAPWRSEAAKRGYASSLALPLNHQGGCLGSLNVYAAEPDAFDPEETGLLQQLADDLAFGVASLRNRAERRKSDETLKRRVEELSSLQRLGRRMGATMSPDDVGKILLEEVASIVALDAALLMLREGEDLLVNEVHAPDGAYAELKTPVHQVGECLCGLAVRDGQPIYVRDIHGDARCTWQECKQANFRSFAALPLRSGEEVMGVLGLASAAEVAFDEQASFLETIADQVAVALENARLNREASELQVLREVDLFRSRLLADVSHELRTPLGLIKIFASTLLREDVVFDQETHLEFLRDIEEEADNLRAIVDNLLAQSRAEGGRLRLALQRVDLMTAVGKAIESAEQRFLHHRFAQNLVSEPVMVNVDVGRIDQVLRNLLDNAAKYSPAGSQITVVGWAEEGEALVRVDDEGVGIAQEHLEHIFERFFRVESEITLRTRGIGLGLALCQEIVKAHGGLIWAESVPGEGSSFTFSLPLAPETGSLGHQPG